MHKIDSVYVSLALVSHRNKARRVGRNVLVYIDKPTANLEQLLNDSRQIRDLAKTKGLGTTLGQLVTEATKGTWRKATDKEAEAFHKKEQALKDYIARKKAQRKERAHELKMSGIHAAITTLDRAGVDVTLLGLPDDYRTWRDIKVQRAQQRRRNKDVATSADS